MLESLCHPQASWLRRLAGVLSPSPFCSGVLEGTPSRVLGEESPHLRHPLKTTTSKGTSVLCQLIPCNLGRATSAPTMTLTTLSKTPLGGLTRGPL